MQHPVLSSHLPSRPPSCALLQTCWLYGVSAGGAWHHGSSSSIGWRCETHPHHRLDSTLHTQTQPISLFQRLLVHGLEDGPPYATHCRRRAPRGPRTGLLPMLLLDAERSEAGQDWWRSERPKRPDQTGRAGAIVMVVRVWPSVQSTGCSANIPPSTDTTAGVRSTIHTQLGRRHSAASRDNFLPAG